MNDVLSNRKQLRDSQARPPQGKTVTGLVSHLASRRQANGVAPRPRLCTVIGLAQTKHTSRLSGNNPFVGLTTGSFGELGASDPFCLEESVVRSADHQQAAGLLGARAHVSRSPHNETRPSCVSLRPSRLANTSRCHAGELRVCSRTGNPFLVDPCTSLRLTIGRTSSIFRENFNHVMADVSSPPLLFVSMCLPTHRATNISSARCSL